MYINAAAAMGTSQFEIVRIVASYTYIMKGQWKYMCAFEWPVIKNAKLSLYFKRHHWNKSQCECAPLTQHTWIFAKHNEKKKNVRCLAVRVALWKYVGSIPTNNANPFSLYIILFFVCIICLLYDGKWGGGGVVHTYL